MASEEGVITYAKTHNDFDVLTWLDKDGNVISQSQKRILGAMACAADTPCLTPHENHHELVAKAVEMSGKETNLVGGMLGNRFSTRYRIVNLLQTCYEDKSSLFIDEEKKEEMKLAIDDIYNYPLLESTKNALGRMLRNKTTDYDIVDFVLEMRENGNLCRIDEDRDKHKDPTIICSMGIKNK